MNAPESQSNRRDFLTGRAAGRALEHAQNDLADAVLSDSGPQERTVSTIRLETRAMACPWSVIMDPGPPSQVMHASDALCCVHDIEARISVYQDDSDLSRVNRLAAVDPQQLDRDDFDLLLRCAELSQATSGAFDPATRSLIQVWKSCRQEDRVPTKDEIASALACSGMGRVRLDTAHGTVAFEAAGVGLDLGAIGKGYAVDCAASLLRNEGVERFLLHGGLSSLYAAGEHDDQPGWPVGIKNPLFTDRSYATILLRDQGMSTSGSNIQFFRHQGRRYGHVLDPRTGWPAEGLLSVTVVAPTAEEADALSTAFYVMGLENARTYCDNHSQIGAILIPHPRRGGRLEPVVCNIPEGDLIFPDAAAETPSA